MLHLAGADAEGERAEGAVGGGMAVTTDDRHTRLGQPQLRADDVHDALLGVTHRIDRHAELGAIGAQRFDLRQADRIGDRAGCRRHVVVLCREGQVGAAHRPAGEAQAVESLWRGDLVDQVQVDVENVRLAFDAAHHMVRPDLFRECPAHAACPSFPQATPALGTA